MPFKETYNFCCSLSLSRGEDKSHAMLRPKMVSQLPLPKRKDSKEHKTPMRKENGKGDPEHLLSQVYL
jgi:hypothetical protein